MNNVGKNYKKYKEFLKSNNGLEILKGNSHQKKEKKNLNDS
jgi:hypothetical protein